MKKYYFVKLITFKQHEIHLDFKRTNLIKYIRNIFLYNSLMRGKFYLSICNATVQVYNNTHTAIIINYLLTVPNFITIKTSINTIQ